MNSLLVIYPPGAGGNHIKNMLCVGMTFANRTELDLNVYEFNLESGQAPGEVCCVGGRNTQPIFIDRLFNRSGKRYVMPAHFGELAAWRSRFTGFNGDIVLITIDQPEDRTRLTVRQNRLGQHIHPYWLDEELLFVYQPQMLQLYFGFDPERILSISLSEFWQKDFISVDAMSLMTKKFDLDLPIADMEALHHKWWYLNFGQGLTSLD